MEAAKLIENVDPDKLYSHVYRLEGVRHPLADPKNLEIAGEYIIAQLESYGYLTNKQLFTLDGFPRSFFNIEGFSINAEKEQIWITSHYDTVYNTPGADDSASSIAIMLECARILATTPMKDHVRFVSFTLEEGNPVHEKKANQSGIQSGLIDKQLRPTSNRSLSTIKTIWAKALDKRTSGSVDIVKDVLEELADSLNPDEIEYVKIRYQGLGKSKESTLTSLQGWGLMGSQYAALYAKEHGLMIKGIINLETIGYTSQEANSQRFVKGVDPIELPKHNTSNDLSVGDFVLIISNQTSMEMGKSYFDNTKNEIIDLASVWLHLPYDYQTISQHFPDALRSDHAPFWKQDIPAIMVVDTANFRNPYYHTPGDTIETLDFDFILQVCQTTLLCAIDLIMVQNG